jgi:hypothetical protein
MRIHPYLSPRCEVRKSIIHGLGTFAKKEIKSGDLIAVIGGDLVTSDEAKTLPEKLSYNLIQEKIREYNEGVP